MKTYNFTVSDTQEGIIAVIAHIDTTNTRELKSRLRDVLIDHHCAENVIVGDPPEWISSCHWPNFDTLATITNEDKETWEETIHLSAVSIYETAPQTTNT